MKQPFISLTRIRMKYTGRGGRFKGDCSGESEGAPWNTDLPALTMLIRPAGEVFSALLTSDILIFCRKTILNEYNKLHSPITL